MAGTKKRDDKRIAVDLGWWPGLAIIACSLVVAGCAWTSAQAQTTTADNPAKALAIPANLQLAEPNAPVFALSPDGSKIVFAARDGGHQQLYLRMTNRDQSTPLPGTDGAEAPFFSPDGEWAGFFAAGKLKKISLAAGNVLTICDAPAGRGGSWGDNGVIVFTPTLTSGLWQVSASGGEPKVLTELKNERGHRWPDVLPGGKAFLYTVAAGGEWDNAQIVVQDFATGQRQTVIASGTYGHYSPTGHLLYAKGNALLAVPFDLAGRKVTGPPVTVVREIVEAPRTGVAQYSFSRSGSLVYLGGGMQGAQRRLVWVGRDGSAQALDAPPRPYISPRLSPDGKKLAVSTEEVTFKIFLYDIASGSMNEFASSSAFAEWSRDGKRLAYRSSQMGPWNLFVKNASGAGEAEQLTRTEHLTEPGSWSPDGNLLAYTELDPVTGRDIWVMPVDGSASSGSDGKPRPIVKTPADDSGGKFSPDGRWLAYSSSESGQAEVYVMPFPGSGKAQKISTQSGSEPVWSHSGRELFYRQGTRLMAVDIKTQPVFSAGGGQVLFQGQYERGLPGRPNYDVSPDDQRFLMIQTVEQEQPAAQIKMVLNWIDELKKKVPTEK